VASVPAAPPDVSASSDAPQWGGVQRAVGDLVDGMGSSRAQWAGGVTDADGGQDAAGHTQRPGDDNHPLEPVSQLHRVQIAEAGDASKSGEHGNGNETAEPSHIVVDCRGEPGAAVGNRIEGGRGEGATVVASPAAMTNTAGRTSTR